jgi:hypothetical protein
MRQIFLSYRRDDAKLMCDLIYEHLVQIYGNPTLFRDIDNLAAGENFPAAIDRAASTSSVMLVIIGPRWLTLADDQGQPRLYAPTDYVRLEIGAALRHRVPIIPLIVEGAAVPKPEQLPPEIAPLAYCEGRFVRPAPDFNNDMQVVVQDLEAYVPLVPLGTVRWRRFMNRTRRVAGSLISLVSLLLVVNAVLNLLNLGLTLPVLTDLIHHGLHH